MVLWEDSSRCYRRRIPVHYKQHLFKLSQSKGPVDRDVLNSVAHAIALTMHDAILYIPLSSRSEQVCLAHLALAGMRFIYY